MSDEQYVPTESDRKVSVLHIVAGHFRGDATKTVEELIAGAEKLHAWVASGKAASKAKAKPAAETKDTPTPTETKKPAEIAKPEVSVDLDSDADDDFLNEGTAEEAVKEPVKAKPATLEDLRAALLDLQKRTDGTTARAVLSKAGGEDTIGKLKPEKYQAVIDAAKKQTDKIAKAA